MSDQSASSDIFKDQMATYKAVINKDIEEYILKLHEQTSQTYGVNSSLVVQAYTDILRRGGKRIRGALTCTGYEMCGGKDRTVMLQAARAIEMMHAYMLIIDDIQDRSSLRRGGPSAHKLLKQIHLEQKWRGEAEHAGVSLALNSALIGLHEAEVILADLEVSDEIKVKALKIMNHTMMVTAHGQTNDIINELTLAVSEKDVESVMRWKTAHYSFLNPLRMGMILAGASVKDTDAITQYAVNMGMAFQIADDLLVVSNDKSEGKDPIDDIREGKQTLLTVYALKNASKADSTFLRRCLGDQNLNQADFKRCKDILQKSGAVDYSKEAARKYISKAQKSLHQHGRPWQQSYVEFLDEMAAYALARNT